jgi:hypothetical protein
MDLSFLKTSRFFNSQDGLNLLRSGGMITMSWGVENFREIEDGGEVKALAFDVNGMHFQGTVILSVNFMDYYEVRFMQEGEILEDMTLTDVFITDVIESIDKIVEYVPEYSR